MCWLYKRNPFLKFHKSKSKKYKIFAEHVIEGSSIRNCLRKRFPFEEPSELSELEDLKIFFKNKNIWYLGDLFKKNKDNISEDLLPFETRVDLYKF